MQQRKQLHSKTSLQAKTPLKAATRSKKQKPPTITKLRREADELMSQYIRLRDSVKKKSGWYGTCITCSKYGLVAYYNEHNELKFTRGWSNGHFVTRGHLIVRLDERNADLQCTFRCNKMKSGEYEKHRRAIAYKRGDEVPELLEQLARDNPDYRLTKEYLNQVISDYTEDIAFLLNGVI